MQGPEKVMAQITTQDPADVELILARLRFAELNRQLQIVMTEKQTKAQWF